MYRILVFNIGATSTKIAIYEDEKPVVENNLSHSDDEMAAYPTGKEQLMFRVRIIEETLQKHGFKKEDFDAVAVRGLDLKNTRKSGTYLVNDPMREESSGNYQADKRVPHSGMLVLNIADTLFSDKQTPIYITSPPSINEMIPEATIAGHPRFVRTPIFHALNTREVGIRLAQKMGKQYNECNFVMAHIGGGTSLSAHQKGVVVDANNVLTGEGPFSTERSLTMPVKPLVDLCFSGECTHEEVCRMIRPEGGVKAYLGTTDMREVESRWKAGDEKASLVFRGLAYQIAKGIGAYCAAIDGPVDAIVITGGVAHSKTMVDLIRNRVAKLAPVEVYPGELEGEALVAGALRVLRGEEEAILYSQN